MSPLTADMELGGRFMGLFVGPNGSGKTVAGASFPGKGLILDFDGRVAPVRNFYPKRRDIEYWTVGIDGTRKDVISFKEFCDKFDALQDRCDYDWVMLDSYTTYSITAVIYQMGLHPKDLKLTKGGLPIPDWDEYKGETGVAVQIMEIAKILPCHFIMTAHPVTRTMATKSGGSVNEVLSSMVRANTLASYGIKTASILPNYFNEMYYFAADASSQVGQGVRRRVQTISAGEIVAKTALPLPAVIDITNQPFYPVFKKILEEFQIAYNEKNPVTEAK